MEGLGYRECGRSREGSGIRALGGGLTAEGLGAYVEGVARTV